MDWLIKAGGTAYPVSGYATPEGGAYTCAGMTLRDYFAAQALALAHADYAKGIPEYDLKAMFGNRTGLTRYEIVSAISLRYADAMLKERAK